MTKTQAVLNYLEAGKGITSMDAIRMFGATRLAVIICNLRKRGYNIVNVERSCEDRYGHTCNFVEYRLCK